MKSIIILSTRITKAHKKIKFLRQPLLGFPGQYLFHNYDTTEINFSINNFIRMVERARATKDMSDLMKFIDEP